MVAVAVERHPETLPQVRNSPDPRRDSNGPRPHGKIFAFEHWGIEPDLVCLSKALTNGMVPASVTLGTKKVFESVYSSLDRCMVHSSTFSENNLAMAAALGVLDQLDRQQLIPRAAQSGSSFNRNSDPRSATSR